VGEAYDPDVAKGWERASIGANTRPTRVERDIRREDLLAPSGGRLATLFAECVLCGVMSSVLYVFFPLLLITFVGFDLGSWLLGAVTFGAVVSAAALFVSELRARRDFLNEF
jgi:hypothetical protein